MTLGVLGFRSSRFRASDVGVLGLGLPVDLEGCGVLRIWARGPGILWLSGPLCLQGWCSVPPNPQVPEVRIFIHVPTLFHG